MDSSSVTKLIENDQLNSIYHQNHLKEQNDIFLTDAPDDVGVMHAETKQVKSNIKKTAEDNIESQCKYDMYMRFPLNLRTARILTSNSTHNHSTMIMSIQIALIILLQEK